MSFFENTRKPAGLSGKVMVTMMNLGHRPLADWGFQFLHVDKSAAVLDAAAAEAPIPGASEKMPRGRGQGHRLFPCQRGKDAETERRCYTGGRCAVMRGSVMDMLFAASQFDAVTAFETVYFWAGPFAKLPGGIPGPEARRHVPYLQRVQRGQRPG